MYVGNVCVVMVCDARAGWWLFWDTPGHASVDVASFVVAEFILGVVQVSVALREIFDVECDGRERSRMMNVCNLWRYCAVPMNFAEVWCGEVMSRGFASWVGQWQRISLSEVYERGYGFEMALWWWAFG